MDLPLGYKNTQIQSGSQLVYKLHKSLNRLHANGIQNFLKLCFPLVFFSPS